MAGVITLTTLPEDWADPVLTRQQAHQLLLAPHHKLFAIMTDATPDTGHGNTEHRVQGYLLASLMPHAQADILTLFVPPQYRRNG